MTRVEGSVALVTGGSRGLGKALVHELYERGAKRVYATARDARTITDDRVVALPLEITDPAAVAAVAERAPDVTILVNNAAMFGAASFLDSPVEDIRREFETNFYGPLSVTRAFAPIIERNGGGHDSVLMAGLCLAPGPLMVVVVSLTVGGRLTRRLGPGPTAAIGALSFALGAASWVWRIGPIPDYAAGLLPGQFLTGTGVGLVLPSLSGVVGQVLPDHRWGAGSSMINTARQVGTVLGTAILVLGYGSAPGLARFRAGWILLAAAALAAGLTASMLSLRKQHDTQPSHLAPDAEGVGGPPAAGH